MHYRTLVLLRAQRGSDYYEKRNLCLIFWQLFNMRSIMATKKFEINLNLILLNLVAIIMIDRGRQA